MEIRPHHLRYKRRSHLREGLSGPLKSTVDRSNRLLLHPR
jgi:hypothetical protein